MVQDTTTLIEVRDEYYINEFRKIQFWEERLEYICNKAKNYDAAKMYGKKVQHCQNNAYILKQDDHYLYYSESRLVSGLMSILAHVYNGSTLLEQHHYKPRFLELLVNIVPDQTINNLLKAFREA